MIKRMDTSTDKVLKRTPVEYTLYFYFFPDKLRMWLFSAEALGDQGAFAADGGFMWERINKKQTVRAHVRRDEGHTHTHTPGVQLTGVF